MKTFVTALMAAATLAGATAASTGSAEAQDWRWRHHTYHGGYYGGHRGGDVAAAAAAGIVGGLILGGIAAQASRPAYVYDEPVVVRRRPARVYYEDAPVVRRNTPPYCRTLIKHDMYGRPYEYKDCDP